MAASTTTAAVLILCISALAFNASFVNSAHHTGAPAPAADCSTVILNMADCLSYVTNDSTATKPEGTCCSGLKTVLKTDAECLCEAFKNSAQLGVSLNITKALELPSACHINAPSATKCGSKLWVIVLYFFYNFTVWNPNFGIFCLHLQLILDLLELLVCINCWVDIFFGIYK